MNRARFRLQAVVVLALIVLVSWPQMRPVRATTVWRGITANDTPQEATENPRLHYGGEKRQRVGYGSLAAHRPAPRYLPPPEAVALGARVNAIVGRARTNLNRPVPYARLILRNLITGEIEARAVADAEGKFTFIDVGLSGYIIELLGADGSVVASSETVAVENGHLKQATVRVAGAASVKALYGNNAPGPTVEDPMRAAQEAGVNRMVAPMSTVSGF